MDWSARMNAALDYLEDNLAGEIDYNVAAEKAYCSLYHFYRVFSAIIGFTPADYVRQRRLTRSASELASSGTTTVMDIALKYGYDSPNAFTRAFRHFHGLTPRSARRPGVKLAACPRACFQFERKEDKTMEYQLLEKPAFYLVGRSSRFTLENGEFADKGRSFWKSFVATQEYKELASLTKGRCGLVTEASVMTAYLPNETGSWDPMINVLGIEKAEGMTTSNFEIFSIPAATWAEFNCTLKTSSAANRRIYSEWFPATGFQRDNKPDIAAFFQVPWLCEIFVRWWIPVIKTQ